MNDELISLAEKRCDTFQEGLFYMLVTPEVSFDDNPFRLPRLHLGFNRDWIDDDLPSPKKKTYDNLLVPINDRQARRNQEIHDLIDQAREKIAKEKENTIAAGMGFGRIGCGRVERLDRHHSIRAITHGSLSDLDGAQEQSNKNLTKVADPNPNRLGDGFGNEILG